MGRSSLAAVWSVLRYTSPRQIRRAPVGRGPVPRPFWLAVYVAVTLAASASAETLGPFQPRPALALYVVADGQPCSARIVVRQGQRADPQRFLLRAFDPDERLVLWHYVEYADPDTIANVTPVEGIELRPSEPLPAEGDVLLDAPLPLDRQGVYQIRISTGWRDPTVELELDRPLSYGVCGQNGDFLPWPDQPPQLHAYVPPHAEELALRGGPAVVIDDSGQALARLEDAKGEATIPIEKTDVLWQFDFADPASWKLRAAGFPLILCASPEAARAIKASVEVLPDGTVVCHQFQRRIAELLPQILAPENVGRAEDLIVPLADRKDAWLADPLRNVILKDSFLPMIGKWLNSQNLDPSSHWSGSLDGWQEKANAAPPENRWDRLRGIEGLWAGASSHYGAAAEHLAQAALYDAPVNPYHGRRELLYRAAAAALRDLMALAEDETWPGTADLDPYPGVMAFCLGQKTLPVYGVAAAHLPDEIREVWTDGLRHIVDRSFPDTLVTCRNQSSHYLVAFQAFADGSGDPRYETLTRLYARRWARGQHQTGYHMECIGPDASYIGMTHWHEAVYYRMSEDPVVLESLRRSYRLFNHTVGPEPDGRMLGGFNFNHRVGEGFYFEQWSGAKGILDDVLPEVGVWAGPKPTPEEQQARRDKAIEQIEKFLAEPKEPLYSGITGYDYWHFAQPDRSAVFPCQEQEPFIRQFADEFVFVKRPAYYTYVYTGQPAGEYYIRPRETLRLPLPDNAETNGGYLPGAKSITPFVGGGLSGFWTPEYGHSLMAANWAPTTHHGIIATAKDGKRYWEDYHAQEHQLDPDAGTLTFTGRIESLPLTYERRYTFEDDRLIVELKLTAEEDLDLADLVECIPLARGGWKPRGATIEAAGQTEGTVTSDRFRVTDSEGAGVEFTFSQPQTLRLIPEGLQTSGWRKLQIGRVELALPATAKAGKVGELSYEVSSASAA